MRAFLQLIDGMKTLGDEAEAALSGPAPDAAAMASLRLAIFDVLGSYVAEIHRRVFEPCLAGGYEPEAARRIKADSIYLYERYRAFAARWRFADAAGEWERYRSEAAEILELMRGSIAASLAEAMRLYCAPGCSGCPDPLCA